MEPQLQGAFAAAPYGVLTLPELERHGVDRRTAQALVDTAVLTRVARGAVVGGEVWAAADAERRHLLASVGGALVSRRPAAVSHTGAAVAHGIPLLRPPPTRAHLSRLDPGEGDLNSRVVLHETYGPNAAPPGHPRVVVPSLAVLGVTELLGFIAGVVALDGALRSGLTTLTECREWRRRLRRRPHVGLWDRVITAADGRAESPLETQIRLLLISLGYRVVPQVRLTTVTGAFVARVDLLLEDLGVVIEVDGAVKYVGRDGSGSPEAVQGEKRRESAITDLGYAVVRVDSATLRDPVQLRRRIDDAASRARPELIARSRRLTVS